jgi:hypothetical protein
MGNRARQHPFAPASKVDLHGCPVNGDGVLDGIDQCDNTPKGAVVDAKGCPVDSDGDGVPDGIDKCANAPPQPFVRGRRSSRR